MTKKSETRKIEAKKKEWDRAMAPVEKFLHEIKKVIREEKNKMMYGKKEKDKIDRFAYEIVWWFKLFVIFCAFEYLFRR